MGHLFFISHAGSEKLLAFALAKKLERLGNQTILYERDFKQNLDFVLQITQSLFRANYTICLLSNNFMNSNWCLKEFSLSFQATKLIPVVVEDCDPRALPFSFDYVDVRGKTLAEQIALISQELPWFLEQFQPSEMDFDLTYSHVDRVNIVLPTFGGVHQKQGVDPDLDQGWVESSSRYIQSVLFENNVVIERKLDIATNEEEAFAIQQETQADIVFYGWFDGDWVVMGFIAARGWQFELPSTLAAPQKSRIRISKDNKSDIGMVLKLALGHLHLGRGRLQLAEANFKEALGSQSIRTPDFGLYGETWAWTGVIQSMLGDHGSAYRSYTESLRFNRDNWAIWSNRCASAIKLKKYGQAVHDGLKAIELGPRSALAHNNLGCAHAYADQYEQALLILSRAVTIDPSFLPAYVNRGTVYLNNGQSDEAEADYTEAIRLGETAYDSSSISLFALVEVSRFMLMALVNRAKLYVLALRYKEAFASVNKAIKHYLGVTDEVHQVEAYRVRGFLYLRIKNFEASLKDFNSLVELTGSADAHLFRAQAYCMMGEYQEALKDLNHALKLQPAHIVALVQRAEVYSGIKRWCDAAADYAAVAFLTGSRSPNYETAIKNCNEL